MDTAGFDNWQIKWRWKYFGGLTRSLCVRAASQNRSDPINEEKSQAELNGLHHSGLESKFKDKN